MKIEYNKKFNFNDLLIKPKRSNLSSRSQVNLEREFVFKHSGRKWTGIPIMVSNMDTTGTLDILFLNILVEDGQEFQLWYQIWIRLELLICMMYVQNIR